MKPSRSLLIYALMASPLLWPDVSSLAGGFAPSDSSGLPPNTLRRVTPGSYSFPQNMDLDTAKQIFGSDVWVQNISPREEKDRFRLISDDETLVFPVAAGANRFDVTFQNVATVNRINVINLKTRGSVRAFVSELPASPGNRSWRPVGGAVTLNPKGVTAIRFATVAARAVRIDLTAARAGRVGPIEAFGNQSIDNIKVVEGSPLTLNRNPTVEEITNQISSASLLSNASVVYERGASSRANPDRMLDGDANTFSPFVGSGPYLAIIDLGKQRPIRRVSMLTSPGVRSVDCVGLAKLPGRGTALLGEGDYSEALALQNPALQIVPLALGQTLQATQSGRSGGPATITLPPNFFGSSNAFNVNIGSGNYIGSVNIPTTPMQYLVIRVNPGGSGPAAIYELNAYTDPRRYRLVPDPEVEWGEFGPEYVQGLNNIFTTPRIPLISK